VLLVVKGFLLYCPLGSLGEEAFNQPALVFLFYSGEELGAEFSNCLRFVEGQTVVHLPAAEVTRHAFRLKDRFELAVEINASFGC